MKLTRSEIEGDDVSGCGDKNRCEFLDKSSGDRIRIRGPIYKKNLRKNSKFIIRFS